MTSSSTTTSSNNSTSRRNSSTSSSSSRRGCRGGGQWLVVSTVLLLLLGMMMVGQVSSDDSSSSSSSSSSLDDPFSNSFKNLEHASCVTLFYRYGRIGCSTEERDSQVGQLVYYDGSNNLYMKEPYVAVIDEYNFHAEEIATMMQDGNNNNEGKTMLRGILILNASQVDYDREKSYYSPAAQTPRGANTPSYKEWYGYNAYPWNAKGQNMIMQDYFGLPMAYISDGDVSGAIREYAKTGAGSSMNKKNKKKNAAAADRETILAEFKYYMGAEDTTSPICLSWKDSSNDAWNPKCLPLGGTSVWAATGSPVVNNNNNNNNNNYRSRNLYDNNNNNNNRQVVMVGTAIDSNSMFHDVVPGVNSAASNILTVLMAAKLIGGISDNTLDQLPKRIAFGLFQGETFGFLGSRAFFRDVVYPGFQCNNNMEVPSVSKNQNSDRACLYPLRHSLQFQNLGQIAGMLTVDQVGAPISDGMLYVHNDGNDGTFGYFLSRILKQTYTSDYTVSYSSVENNGNGIAMPPTPLTSLTQLTQGAVGGAVLTGYDYAFSNQIPFHSHLESADFHEMNLDAIAAAATLVARTAFAAAYDDGSYDYETAAQVARNKIGELSSNDETLNQLANCLFVDGNCDLLKKYSRVETINERERTGLNIGSGYPLGTPPNYYTNVYNGMYGQPFVQVGDYVYGAYNENDYGRRKTDAFGLQPRLLARSLRGLMDDYLGRGSNNNDNPVECFKASDCEGIQYCQHNGDKATCTGGGVCVCQRAHYHQALDEALEPAANMYTGYFNIKDDDDGTSPIYTEPYWSSDVGVRIFRDVGLMPGLVTLGCGIVLFFISGFAAFVVLVGLKKEKMY